MVGKFEAILNSKKGRLSVPDDDDVDDERVAGGAKGKWHTSANDGDGFVADDINVEVAVHMHIHRAARTLEPS